MYKCAWCGLRIWEEPFYCRCRDVGDPGHEDMVWCSSNCIDMNHPEE